MSNQSEADYKSFPNPFATQEEKESKAYGLAYGNAIWTNYRRTNVVNNNKRQRDIINRKYAEGLESVQKHKDRLDVNGDTSYLNLDFNPTTRIAMLVDNIVGKFMNQDYKINCTPNDPSSKTKLDDDRDEMFANMFLKPLSDEIEKKTGLPIVPKDKHIPESDEEAELHFQLNYKQDAAISMEKALTYVFDNNQWRDVTRRVLRDLIVLKKAAVFRYYDENNNIKIDYADPIDIITPYSKWDDFRNIDYQAIQRSYTIREIAQMTTEFSEEQLYEMAKAQAGKNSNAGWSSTWATSYEGYYNNNWGLSGRPYDNFNIIVLEFYFLSIDTSKYVKKERNLGGYYFDKKSMNYEAPKNSKSKREVIEKGIQYRYEGKLILDTPYIFGYKKSENIDRERVAGSYSPKTELPITMIYPNMYDMENKSLVERMIPHEDQINLIHLKAQQLLIKARPPGLAIDLEGIETAAQGMGSGGMKPTDITQLYDQTGNYIFRSRDANGEVINSRVITPLENGIARDFQLLFIAYNNELQMINDVIGFNAAVDASTPDVKALVGTQKMASIATNNSLRPLHDAFISVAERVARRVSLMVQDSIEHNNKGFMEAIGRYATETLKYGKKIALNEFDIKIELLPDDQERAEIEQLIMLGIQTQSITSGDAIIVRRILKTNVKLAEQMLILRETKNRAAKVMEAQQASEQNGQVQTQAAQAGAQAQQQAQTQKSQEDVQMMQAEYQLKGQLSAQEHEQRMKEIELQNQAKKEIARDVHDSKLTHAAFTEAVKPVATTV